jgi:hypothetical protein
MKNLMVHDRKAGLKHNMRTFASVQHDQECDFMTQVYRGFGGSIGEGEISGGVDFGFDHKSSIQLAMSDGWNQSINIGFEYCPICGIKLKDLREELRKLLETEVWVFRYDFEKKVVRGVVKSVNTSNLVLKMSEIKVGKNMTLKGKVTRYETQYSYPIFLSFSDLKSYVIETHKLKPNNITEGM